MNDDIKILCQFLIGNVRLNREKSLKNMILPKRVCQFLIGNVRQETADNKQPQLDILVSIPHR